MHNFPPKLQSSYGKKGGKKIAGKGVATWLRQDGRDGVYITEELDRESVLLCAP